jgi:hypothetical protein
MRRAALILAGLLSASCASQHARVDTPAARAGDRWTYQESNAYNGIPTGKVDYRVLAGEGDALTLEVAHDKSKSRVTHTYPPRWSEFELVDGRRFVFPLGTREGAAVIARSVETQESVPIKIYERVSGPEKVRVPAGEFDAVKIFRNIYVDDADWYKSQTSVRQSEWYAPSLAAAIKRESQASYRDLRRGRHDVLIEGDWTRWELVSYSNSPT